MSLKTKLFWLPVLGAFSALLLTVPWIGNAVAQNSTGVFQSFLANRLAGSNFHLPDSNATMAAFWDATRGNLLGDSTFCASSASKVLAISIVDSAGIERNVPGCEQYSSNGAIVRGISLEQARATLDGQPLEVLRHPNAGAEKFETIINPNNDTLALASCDDFITINGGIRLNGDQCYGVTFMADVNDLAPGLHSLQVELIHPDAVCGGNGVFDSTVSIDPGC